MDAVTYTVWYVMRYAVCCRVCYQLYCKECCNAGLPKFFSTVDPQQNPFSPWNPSHPAMTELRFIMGSVIIRLTATNMIFLF